MNKKQRILTSVALVAFGAIIFFHYCGFHYDPGVHYLNGVTPGRGLYFSTTEPAIDDVRMLLFALAVFYAGLFFILGNKKD